MSLNLAYVEHGSDQDATSTPVVLLHAFPMAGAVMEPLATRLAGERRVVVPDLRGFGASADPVADVPSLDLMADDVAVLLDHCGFDQVVLGGLSLGGYVTMAMLRHYPDRVAAAILMDTKAAADADEARANRERVAASVIEQGSPALYPMLDTLVSETTRRQRPQLVEQLKTWIDEVRPRSAAWAQRAIAVRPSSFETLAHAGVPGAVVVGDEDQLSPRADAEAMANAFAPPARVHVIASAGHLAPVEDPEAVAGACREVLSRVP